MEKLPIDAALRWCEVNHQWDDLRVWWKLIDREDL